LEYLAKKPNGFDYIDTHAGAGLYYLKSAQAKKLKEYASGIGKLQAADLPELATYFKIVHAVNRNPAALNYYPGSPIVALNFLRAQDKAWLYELHPQDFYALEDSIKNHRRVKIFNEDGFAGLPALLPPASRRCLVLMDPSYEIKRDYDLVVEALIKAHKKFSSGIFALWYPVVDREKIVRMEKKFIHSGIADIQRFELTIAPDSEERGMTGSGVIVINPPWGLKEKMLQVLPKLVHMLSENQQGAFRCEVLVPE
jgi:23S rRNA (adenine2030-N6)-methyltransferase